MTCILIIENALCRRMKKNDVFLSKLLLGPHARHKLNPIFFPTKKDRIGIFIPGHSAFGRKNVGIAFENLIFNPFNGF